MARPDTPAAARLLYSTLGVADPAHWLHARYLRDTLRRYGPLRPTRILDAGCGRGDYSFYLAQRFPAAEVMGIDVDSALIRRNRETSELLGTTNARFEEGDLARLGDDATFDLIVSVDVLEHIEAQESALANLSRALRPGGLAFYHIPTVRPKPVLFSRRLNAFHEWAEVEHVAEDLTAEQFATRVRASGLDVLEQRRTFGRYTGELATSLFALFFADSTRNRIAQALVSPLCRMLAMADPLRLDHTRYATAITARRPA